MRWPERALLLLALAGAARVAGAAEETEWVSERERYETWLREAEILSVEDVGVGVTAPRKATLRMGDVVFHAVYKPIKRGRHGGFWESHQAEVAAYELDKLLGLGMVPPTIVRRVESDLGSLQLWIEGCETYKKVEDQAPSTPQFSWQISRMKAFDNLIHNDDRNAGNFLVDSRWNIVLIDHSRAFLGRKDLLKGKSKLPVTFDRRLAERLRSLRREELEPPLGNLLTGGQIESILERRDRLLEHLGELILKQGEAATLFE